METMSIADRVRAMRKNVNDAIPKRANFDKDQYCWHPLMNITHMDVMAINEGLPMKRLKWQPITRAPRWEHILAVPEGVRVAIRPAAPEKPREAMYWIAPGKIVGSLETLYAESGLMTSTILSGVDLEMFARLYLDEIFFPENDKDLPGTYSACHTRIQSQIAKLKDGALTDPYERPIALAEELISHVVSIGEEMIASLNRSAQYLHRHMDERHAEMEKAKVDTSGRYRGYYDQRERLILAWLEMAPRDQAINRLAQDHNSMGETVAKAVKESMAATAEMMKASQVDVSALGAAIGKSLAESLGPLIKGSAPQAAQPVNNQNKPK